MRDRVDHFASLCCPDFIYKEDEPRGLKFGEILLYEEEDTDPIRQLGVTIEDQGQHGHGYPHAFTRWSRSQLLSHMGTREKWFRPVTLETQAEELNRRAYTLHNHMLRTMRSADPDSTIRIVRGLVSSQYGDIPDTHIMKALTELMPDGQAMRGFSGKTDRALYVYAITEDELSIPNTQFRAFPGVIIKNSEVGFTSLWVIPILFFPRTVSCATLERESTLRRIHRGSAQDLKERFRKAIEDASVFWKGLGPKLAGLRTLLYANEEAAIESMRGALFSANATKQFAWACERTYKAARHTSHNGLNVFEAVLAAVGRHNDKNDTYALSALAGALLLKLVT